MIVHTIITCVTRACNTTLWKSIWLTYYNSAIQRCYVYFFFIKFKGLYFFLENNVGFMISIHWKAWSRDGSYIMIPNLYYSFTRERCKFKHITSALLHVFKARNALPLPWPLSKPCRYLFTCDGELWVYMTWMIPLKKRICSIIGLAVPRPPFIDANYIYIANGNTYVRFQYKTRKQDHKVMNRKVCKIYF